MILLLLSAAQGPSECCLAVSLAIKTLLKEAESRDVEILILEQELGRESNTMKSALFKLEGLDAMELAKDWNGTLQWICQSPYRVKHKRKNWFFTGSYTQHEVGMFVGGISVKNIPNSQINFETCRSSGPGGQHANKTSSAVRATHTATGISVKVQSERSQHANKRLAKALIERKLIEKENQKQEAEKSQRHKLHHSIERGNATRVFKGLKFVEIV